MPIGTPTVDAFKYWYISFAENGNSYFKSQNKKAIEIPEMNAATNNPIGIDMQR